jgi:O-antigen/teichoic acid export membrane protein
MPRRTCDTGWGNQMLVSAAKPVSHLTSGRLLAHNTIWNLFGQILPMVVGFVTIPIIIRGMGVERFGVLSLAFVVLGYFSLFDLGIGRALTKLVADKLGTNEEQVIPPLAWTSLLLMLLLGIVGALVTLALSPWLVHRLLKIPQALQAETLHGFYLLAASIPIVTTTAGLRGILEALQRFRIVNVIRIPLSIFSLAGPLLVLPYSHSLLPVITVLVLGRLIGCGAHILACFRAMPSLYGSRSVDGSFIVPLIRLGGWMTVTNITGPILLYMDRFLVGSLISVTAVAYYTTPADMITRLTVLPGAIVGVLFPAFAVSLLQDPERTGLLLVRGTKYVFFGIFPVALTIVTFAPEGLRLWLGTAFEQNGASVLRWLAAGVFILSLSTVPFVLTQSAGRPDFSAKLHLVELPVYFAGLWFLTRHFGIRGTAIAWTVRASVDAVILFLYSHRLLPQRKSFLMRLGMTASMGLSALYAASLPESVVVKCLFLLIGLLVFGSVSWTWALAPTERDYLVGRRMRALIRGQLN